MNYSNKSFEYSIREKENKLDKDFDNIMDRYKQYH